jgi:hypothetical protein
MDCARHKVRFGDRVLDQRLSHFVAEAGDHLKHAIGNAGLAVSNSRMDAES